MEQEKYCNAKIDQAYQEYAKNHYNNSIKGDIFTFFGVIVGSVLIAANMTIMLRSANMIPAGFSGLIMLVQSVVSKYTAVNIPFTPMSVILNAFPAYLCFRHVGKRFTVFSCMAILLISFLTDLIPSYTLTNDRLLVAVFGGIVSGCGSALILRSGACSGGTDFLAMFFAVKKGKNTFNTVLVCNSLLILVSGILFGMESALYTIIYQYVVTSVVNFIYNRFARKTLFIVTEKPYEVADSIMATTHHACTILNSAEGSYTREQKHVVYTIVGAQEANLAIKVIKGTDPNAFINTLNSDSVTGTFFQRPIN